MKNRIVRRIMIGMMAVNILIAPTSAKAASEESGDEVISNDDYFGEEEEENPYAVSTVENAGHIIADVFGGSPELDNLTSQAKNINQKAYREIERTWEKALKEVPPKKVTDIKIEIIYEGNSPRPKAYKVKYRIDGRSYSPEIIYNN